MQALCANYTPTLRGFQHKPHQTSSATCYTRAAQSISQTVGATSSTIPVAAAGYPAAAGW
jgi:hypothetical protein